MKRLILICFPAFLLQITALNAQVLTHGPVFGAMTHNSARVFVRTSATDTITLEIDTDNTFPSPTAFTAITEDAKDTSAIVNLSGLTADQLYYCRILLNGSQQGPLSSFQTFPTPGTVDNYTFAFGSCLRAGFTDSIFLEISQHDPGFFLEIGDWGYPDSTDQLPNDPSFFPEFYSNMPRVYKWKYSLPNVNDFMRTTPFDYVYDDHDFMNDNSSATTGSLSVVNFPYTDFFEFPSPVGARRNSIRAYDEFFPAYPLPDTTQGIYHSFKFGNAEIFVTDNRSSRSPNTEVFTFTGPFYAPWEFNPQAGHTILGASQMKWLENALMNSTADWKFVATGTVFNQSYTEVIDLLLQIQLIQIPDVGSGASLASATADSWGGFPVDGNALRSFCATNNIKNVIMLSGDSHNSAIDDGSNGGFPEIMSGNLAITNSRTAFLMDSLLNIDVWSEGGQGLMGNNNFNNCFGKVQIFGSDSVRLCAIDQFGTEVVCHTVQDGWIPAAMQEPAVLVQNNMLDVFPNPAQNRVTVSWKGNTAGDNAAVCILDLHGKLVKRIAADELQNGSMEIQVSELAAGNYLVRFEDGNVRALKSMMITR